VNCFAVRISAGLAWQTLPTPSSALAGRNAGYLLAGNLVEEANLRLQQRIERFERRLLDLESAAARFQAATRKSPGAATGKDSGRQAGSRTIAAKSTRRPGVSLAFGNGESLIFLPRDKGAAQFSSYRHFLQKLRRRFQLMRIAKSQ